MIETEPKLINLKKARRKVMVAGETAVLCGLFFLLLASENWEKSTSKDFVHMEQVFLRSAWQYFFAALASLGLSIGMFHKSRVCAIVLLVAVVMSFVIIPLSLIFWVHRLEGNPLPIVAVGLLLCIPFYLGMRGAFAYHQLRQDKQTLPQPSEPTTPE